MNIIIIGDGKIGRTVTEHLSKEGHDIVVIDKNPKVIDQVVNEYDVKGVCGNGASYDVQLEAQVDKADLVIALTSTDELNILCCLVAKKIGAKQTIARVRNPEYISQVYMMREELGLSMTVNPELEAASEISRLLRFPSAIKLDSFANGKVDLVEIKVPENSPLCGNNLSYFHDKYKVKVLICAVCRADQVFIPKGEFIIQPNDKVYLTSDPTEITKLFKKLNILKEKSRNVMVIGGGRIAYYLATLLKGLNISLKIIEKDTERCIMLSEAFPDITIINGDGSDQKVLLEENINGTDALVSITGYDEENIIISMFAKTQGVDKIITKINRNSYGNILESVGIESVITPRDITTDHIIRYVRGMPKIKSSEFRTLYRLVGNRVEGLEFYIPVKTNYTGIPLKDLDIKKDILLASIIRNNEVIIPNGLDTIEPLDTVIIFTTSNQIKDVSDIIR